MGARTAQWSFSKGEISEELVARVDVPAYATALKRARNVCILKYGGVTKRPGTRFVARAWNDTLPVRLMPFQFSLTQTYALEMGQGYMRPAANGGLVLESSLAIQGIATGPTTVLQVAFHGYNVGDQLYFNDVNGATWLNGRLSTVTAVYDDSHFAIDIDSTGLDGFLSDAGTGEVRTAPATPPVADPVVPPVATPEPEPSVGSNSFSGDDVSYGLRYRYKTSFL